MITLERDEGTYEAFVDDVGDLTINLHRLGYHTWCSVQIDELFELLVEQGYV